MATFLSLRRALVNAVPYRMRDLEKRGGPAEADVDSSACFLFGCDSAKTLDCFYDPRRPFSVAANIFNKLAISLAVLSWDSGGVDFLGQHWEYGQTILPE